MCSVSGLAPLPSESKNSTAGVSVSATAEVTVYVHTLRCRMRTVALPIVSGCVSTTTLPPQLVPARHAMHRPAQQRLVQAALKREGRSRRRGMRRTRGGVGAGEA